MSTVEHPVPVVTPEPRPERASRRRPRARPNLAVLAVAAALACSPLAFAYYDLTAWAPLGLGTAILLVMLAFGPKRRLGVSATTATAGMALLVVLSFASMLWAESRDSAWTSANELAVYSMVFAIGMIAIRTRTTAWSTMVTLGLPALATAVVLAAQFIIGGGAGAFLDGRLNAPVGYANGTAALLVMGSWPWLGLAERLRSHWWRAAAVSAAALIASAAVLTQTRAIVLAAAAGIALTLLRNPGRTRRAANQLIVLAAVAASAHWTLHVYSSTGPAHHLAPDSATLRGAGLALLGAAALALLGTAGLALLVDVGLSDRALSRVPRMRPRRKRRRRVITLPVLLAMAVAVAVGATVERGSILAQWHDFTTLNDGRSTNDRFLAPAGGPRYDLWRIALDEFAADPVGGVGAGNYADQEFRRRRHLEHVTSPHSLELQMLAELGVGGALGLLLLVVPVLASGVTRPVNRLAGGDTGLTTAAAGMFAAWLAGSSVDWLYDIPGLTGMAMLAAAVLLVPAAAPATAGSSPARSRATVGLTLGIVALFAASLGRQYVATLYTDSGQALVQRHPLNALRKLRTAEELDPWSLRTQYAVASAYARVNDYPAARTALLRAARLEPENYVPPALLGDIAVRAGYRRVAVMEYRRALRLDPLDSSFRRPVSPGGM